VKYFPDGQRLLVAGGELNQGLKLYVQPVDGGKPVPIPTRIYAASAVLSLDGKRIAGFAPGMGLVVQGVDGGEPKAIPCKNSCQPIGWTEDPDWIYVRRSHATPSLVERLRISTGEVVRWKEIAPADLEGVTKVAKIAIAPDGKSYVYSFHRTLSELFIVDGWAN